MSVRAADIIIIGAGAAGLELARIASRQGLAVVLFEQGAPNGRHLFQRIPLLVGRIIGNRRFVDAAVTVPLRGAGNRCLPVLTGRGLGGSSRVNGNVAYAGPLKRYQHVFADMNLDFSNIINGLHDDINAPRPYGWADGLSGKFLTAAAKLGAPSVTDPDVQGGFAGASVLHVNTKHGLRHNHLEGFRANAAPQNIRIIRAPVERIILDGRRATGVAYNGGEIHAGEVVLSAGAISSPLLLMQSGIAAADMLQAADLPVLHDLPHVGRHLKDHANFRLPFSCPGHNTLNQKTRGLRVLWEGAKYVLGRKDSILRGPGASAGANFADGDIFHDGYRIQLVHFTQDRSQVSDRGILFERAQKASLGIYALWPKSEGSVRLAAKGVQIDPGFLRDPADVEISLHGMAKARALMAEMGFEPDLLDAPDEDILRNGVYSGYHLIGSNRMSVDAGSGVVGADFAVHGLEGLSVCDASVMPDHLSSHSYLPTIAMARMFAQQRGWAA